MGNRTESWRVQRAVGPENSYLIVCHTIYMRACVYTYMCMYIYILIYVYTHSYIFTHIILMYISSINYSIKNQGGKSLKDITHESSCPYISSSKYPDIMMKPLIFFSCWK